MTRELNKVYSLFFVVGLFGVDGPHVLLGRLAGLDVADDDTVWIGLEYFCEEGDSFWNMSEEDVTKFAISDLTRMRVINGPDEVIDSHRERVRKAYPAYFDTYEHMDELIEYLDGFGNLAH